MRQQKRLWMRTTLVMVTVGSLVISSATVVPAKEIPAVAPMPVVNDAEDIPAPADFDGDGLTDTAVWRPSTGQWIWTGSQSGLTTKTNQFGVAGDIPVPADYNGDGYAERAVWRPSNGVWYVEGAADVGWGVAGDIPVPGDYNTSTSTLNRKASRAIFRPSDGTWWVHGQSTVVQWGQPGDVPVPGFYDFDRALNRAVFRPSTGQWIVHGLPSQVQPVIQWGVAGDIPLPGMIYRDVAIAPYQWHPTIYRPGDGTFWTHGRGMYYYGQPGDKPVAGQFMRVGLPSPAVYRPATGSWHLPGLSSGIAHGQAGDIPVPANYYQFDVKVEPTVFRPSDGTWRKLLPAGVYNPPIFLGAAGDIPVPGKWNRQLGIVQPAVYRPSTGMWYGMPEGPYQWGVPGDIPVPGDYNGDQVTDLAIYRPSDGVWWLNQIGTVQFGAANTDIPVPADFDGDGMANVAVFRPSTGAWYIAGSAYPEVYIGQSGDIPVPADYNGDTMAEPAVYRPDNATWYVHGKEPVQFGQAGDLPAPGDYDGDGKTDIAVFRPSNGTWYMYGLSFEKPCGYEFPAGTTFRPGDTFTGCNGGWMTFEHSGNFALYDETGTRYFSSGTEGTGVRAEFGTDGQLAVFDAGNQRIWSAGNTTAPYGRLSYDDRSGLTIYRDNPKPQWSQPDFMVLRKNKERFLTELAAFKEEMLRLCEDYAANGLTEQKCEAMISQIEALDRKLRDYDPLKPCTSVSEVLKAILDFIGAGDNAVAGMGIVVMGKQVLKLFKTWGALIAAYIGIMLVLKKCLERNALEQMLRTMPAPEPRIGFQRQRSFVNPEPTVVWVDLPPLQSGSGDLINITYCEEEVYDDDEEPETCTPTGTSGASKMSVHFDPFSYFRLVSFYTVLL